MVLFSHILRFFPTYQTPDRLLSVVAKVVSLALGQADPLCNFGIRRITPCWLMFSRNKIYFLGILALCGRSFAHSLALQYCISVSSAILAITPFLQSQSCLWSWSLQIKKYAFQNQSVGNIDNVNSGYFPFKSKLSFKLTDHQKLSTLYSVITLDLGLRQSVTLRIWIISASHWETRVYA